MYNDNLMDGTWDDTPSYSPRSPILPFADRINELDTVELKTGALLGTDASWYSGSYHIEAFFTGDRKYWDGEEIQFKLNGAGPTPAQALAAMEDSVNILRMLDHDESALLRVLMRRGAGRKQGLNFRITSTSFSFVFACTLSSPKRTLELPLEKLLGTHSGHFTLRIDCVYDAILEACDDEERTTMFQIQPPCDVNLGFEDLEEEEDGNETPFFTLNLLCQLWAKACRRNPRVVLPFIFQ